MKTKYLIALFIVISSNSYASMDLAKSKNCLACHAQDKKLVGPSFNDIKVKYDKDSAAVEKLSKKIIEGSSGGWGPVPMPKNTQVTQDDANLLMKWILNK